MSATKLFTETVLGKGANAIKLKNRFVMAAMTRNRSTGTYPNELMAEHYSQRSSAGMIISDATLVEPQGTDWSNAPGIWSDRHVEGWKKVVQSVHKAGGRIVCQLMHVGRVAHPTLQAGLPNVGPSAILAKGGKFHSLKDQPGFVLPEAIENPSDYVATFQRAAENAKKAGFDGVQVHAANGYLVGQFLESHSNERKDKYGGSLENRARFLMEIVDSVSKVYDTNQIGVKLTPGGGYNDMGEGTEKANELYSYVIKELDDRKIGFIELARYAAFLDADKRGNEFDYEAMCKIPQHASIVGNTDYDAKQAEAHLASGLVTAVSFGRPFLANPDFVERVQHGHPFADVNWMSAQYTPGAAGYTDYPAYKP